MKEKKEGYKPSMTTELGQGIAGERHLDLRVGEPTLFHVVLENPNPDESRIYELSITSSNDKIPSLTKLVTNIDELEYWHTYGKLESSVLHDGKQVSYISSIDVKEDCILQNEIIVRQNSAIAVPLLMRSYKKTGFEKERLQVKATYKTAKVNAGLKKRKGANVSEEQEERTDVHRFTVTERFQPSMPLQAFEPRLAKEKNLRKQSITLIPTFKTFFKD